MSTDHGSKEYPRPAHDRLPVDRLPLAYVRFDADHRVLDWNPAAEAMFGYTRDEIVGEVLFDRILPRPMDDRVSDTLRRLHAGDMRVWRAPRELVQVV